MGRYTGPKHRVTRRFAENIWGTKKSPLASRPYKAGQHGKDGKRTKITNYGAGMAEKQKLKFFYQLREKSFRRYYHEALRLPGNTGETLMQMLERRLDNIIYRLGFAPTNRAARQLVAHGHVRVNGKKVDRASFLVSVGDKVTIKDKSKGHIQVQEAISAKPQVLSYLKADVEKLEGELVQVPRRKDIPVIVNERLVIEFLGR